MPSLPFKDIKNRLQRVRLLARRSLGLDDPVKPARGIPNSGLCGLVPFTQRQSVFGLPALVWSGSLGLVWIFLLFFPIQSSSLIYGSFLVWALSSGWIWGRRAPFLVVGIFLVVSVSLSWEELSTDAWRSRARELGLGTALVFFSSLSSALSWALFEERKRSRLLQDGLMHEARFHIWGRMTVTLGHELRNQIAIVTGYLDQMKDDELPPTFQRKIERSLLANERMLKLLSQLRMMTRDCAHEPLAPLALESVLSDALAFMEKPLEYRGVTARLSSPPDLPLVLGHPNLIQTLLVHLLLHSLDRYKEQEDPKGKVIDLQLINHEAGLILHASDRAKSAKVWDYAHENLAEQFITRLEANWEQSLDPGKGWSVMIRFRTLDARSDSNAKAAAGYS